MIINMIYNATKKTRKALNKLRKQALKKPKKSPDISSGQFLRFWMFQQFCVFYVVMIFLKISLCFFSSANITQKIDLYQIYFSFLRKK